jgi:hypothetical protein
MMDIPADFPGCPGPDLFRVIQSNTDGDRFSMPLFRDLNRAVLYDVVGDRYHAGAHDIRPVHDELNRTGVDCQPSGNEGMFKRTVKSGKGDAAVSHNQGFFIDQKENQVGIGLDYLNPGINEERRRITDLVTQMREQPGDVTFSYRMTFLCLEFYHGSAG